jgi:hypothetical protein
VSLREQGNASSGFLNRWELLFRKYFHGVTLCHIPKQYKFISRQIHGSESQLDSYAEFIFPRSLQNFYGQPSTPGLWPLSENQCVTGLARGCGYLFCWRCLLLQVQSQKCCFPFRSIFQHANMITVFYFRRRSPWDETFHIWFDWMVFISCSECTLRMSLNRLHILLP